MTEAMISQNLLLKTQMHYGQVEDMMIFVVEHPFQAEAEEEIPRSSTDSEEDSEGYIERFWNGQLGITQTLRGYPEAVPLSGNFV